MKKILYTRTEIEQIVVMERLHLYNRGEPCGAKALRHLLDLHAIKIKAMASEFGSDDSRQVVDDRCYRATA